jgi:hypothetical protein
LICFSLPIPIVAPVYFGIAVLASSADPGAFWTFTDFGQTIYFSIYALLALLVENVLPLISLIILNKISLAKFKQIMWRLSHNNQRADKVSFAIWPQKYFLLGTFIEIWHVFFSIRLFFFICLSQNDISSIITNK